MIRLGEISTGLALGADGIWHAGHSASVSYPEHGNERCAELEDTSFWFSHRNACITAAVKRFPPEGPVFDIGGGNGFVARGLEDAGFETVVVEPGAAGARVAMERGLAHVVCATLEEARFQAGSIANVGLFDVIEHMENDDEFLELIHSLLRDTGRVYATVPAYGWLWSAEDAAAGHFRRHTIATMTRLLESSGFAVEFASYFFKYLPVAIFALRALPSRLGLERNVEAEQEHAPPRRFVGRILARQLAAEVRSLQAGRRIRFGASCLVVARKRSG